MNKILVINLARLGDIVQSTPMFKGLKLAYPDCHISLLVNSKFNSICPLLPYVDEILDFDFKKVGMCIAGENAGIEKAYDYIKYLFCTIREMNYSHIINVTPHYIGIIATFLAGDRSILQSDMAEWQKYYINITRHWKTLPFNVVDLFIKVAGLSPQKIIPELVIDNNTDMWADNFLKQHGLQSGELLIGFHTGASTREKQWPIEYFAELSKRIISGLPARIILYGTATDIKDSSVIENSIPGKVIHAIGKTTHAQLAALMKKTALLITNDTGPMHIAAACSSKVISMHMGKEKCDTTGAYGEGHMAVQPRLQCHPCEYPEKCYSLKCRKVISPNLVFSLVRYMTDGTKPISSVSIADDLLNADVFVSAFDPDGLLNYYPLWKSELPLHMLCNLLLRMMWNMLLTRDIKDEELHPYIQNAVGKLITIVCSRYTTDHLSALQKAWIPVVRFLDTLCDYGMKGITLAEHIEQYAVDPFKHIHALQDLTRRIEEIDYKIISLGETSQYFATITYMFSVEKEKLDDKELIVLARKTVDIYKKLHMRCSVISELANKFYRHFLQTDNQSSGDNKALYNFIESYHDNLCSI